ncbi:alpha/beta hydrolase [Nonomuraea sp. GTA35]|uniref:alpha/beta hydrolase n=1 Tax=Nonomuraea sp. GTA35 TaxID=1676746 RepID=UPI0035C19F78
MSPRSRRTPLARLSLLARLPVPARLRRKVFTAVLATSVVVPLAGSEVPAPAPNRPPGGLTEARYAAVRQGILAAERMAAGRGQSRRAAALRAMAEPGQRFLFFDGRAGGRSAEVFGDLAGAARVAVLVPGSDTGLDTYGRAPVWAARGTRDWIANVPHVQLRLPFLTLGLGLDPVSPSSGARVFAAGDGGHSDYLRPGSLFLRNAAAIVSGVAPDA